MCLKWRAIDTDATKHHSPNDSQSLLHATLSFPSMLVTLSFKGHILREPSNRHVVNIKQTHVGEMESTNVDQNELRKGSWWSGMLQEHSTPTIITDSQ